MPTPNPEHLRQVKALVNQCRYLRLLDMNITDLEANLCRATMEVQEKHMNPFMNIHGGVYASMVDHMTFWAAYATLPEDMGYTTIDVSVHDLRGCNTGLLTVEARMIRQGGTMCLCVADITDEAGHLMAHGSSKLFVSPNLQKVQAMIDSIDPTIVLPPKFLDD